MKTKRSKAFTLLEIIGALAVIVLVLTIFISGIQKARQESRINKAVLAFAKAREATFLYLNKYGHYGLLDGNIPTNITEFRDWDRQVLVPLKLLEHPFDPGIGTNARLIMSRTLPSSAAAAADNAAYDVDGNPTNIFNDAWKGQFVIQAEIEGISREDALGMNNAVEGKMPTVSELYPGLDISGVVKYSISTNGIGTLRIYIARH